MKSLVLYDSNFGNTQKIAEIIAVFIGGKAVSIKEFTSKELEGVHLLVVGSPINAWRPTVGITAFLYNLKPLQLKRISVAAFDTRVKSFLSGNAAKRIAKALSAAGGDLITPPLGFYVKKNEGPLLEGEIEKAESWATHLKTINRHYAIRHAD